jgi:hypothetical protein
MAMSRSNRNGRGRGPGRRGDVLRNRARLFLEALESRTLLDGGGVPRPWLTNNNLADTQNGPMANAGPLLIKAYQDYQAYLATGQRDSFATSGSNSQRGVVRFDGDNAYLDVVILGDLRQGQGALSLAGMKITGSDATSSTVEGTVPISALPQVAALPMVVSVRPVMQPISRQQGSANNQAEQALFVDVARSTYNVNGAGIGIGVISDSINRAPNLGGNPAGLAGSVATKDLPANVQILQDMPNVGTPGVFPNSDEGRAMLEQIYDLAPGAQLFFATGTASGVVGFANNIRALANAGASVIVDDLGFLGEPVFQDGVVAGAVKDVATNKNVVYVSAAGNDQNSGYDSPVFGVTTATIGGFTGRFVNFNPNGGVTTQVPLTVNAAGLADFQFDAPFFSTNGGVTSNVNILFLDANGNVVASGNANTIATQTPEQMVNVPATATSFAVQIVSGNNIGRIHVQSFGAGSIAFSQQFGSTGGIIYPTTFGQPTSPYGIGVGAVPWFQAPPVGTQSPLQNEGFSSFGPVVQLFDAAGNRLQSPLRLLKPDVSATDANNTSFFGSTNAVPPGLATNNYNQPNFFGTSSAAPNLAAVAALMRQLSPNSSYSQIRDALITSALPNPLNPAKPASPKISTSVGLWDPQGGYGLINAPRALAQVDVLRVSSTTPANGSNLTALPSTISVTYTYPVDPATIGVDDIRITGPSGTTVTVTGATVDPQNPNKVNYTYNLAFPTGVTANGQYTLNVVAGSVVALNGKLLAPSTAGGAFAYTSTFNVQDAIAPTVTNTNFVARYVIIQFSEAMQPSTINRNTVRLERVVPGQPNVLINSDPGLQVVYQAAQNRAVIDLTNVPQSLLLSGDYIVTVTDAATDLVGNKLDGEFYPNKSVFPSGDGTAGGTFVQLKKGVVLQAPIIASLTLDPASDTGIPADGNTAQNRPFFVGTVTSQFPAAVAGLQVAIKFNANLPPGQVMDSPSGLQIGFGGRGFTGSPDLVVTTDTSGNFRFQAPSALPDGFHILRAIVVGQSEVPPNAGLSRQLEINFRVDTTHPTITSVSPAPGSFVNTFNTVTINMSDPVLPSVATSPLAVPTSVTLPALNAATVVNVSNYTLIRVDPTTGLPSTNPADNFSSQIKSATFVPGPNRPTKTSPFTGQIVLSIGSGVPAGKYQLSVLTATASNPNLGVTDAAGNAIDGDTATPGLQNFTVTYDVQPTPVYVTNVTTVSPDATQPGGFATDNHIGDYFELPTPGNAPRAEAPPVEFWVDFSNPLPAGDYSGSVQLVRSANSANSASDGDFTQGSSTISNLSVILYDPSSNLIQGQPGFVSGTRLIVRLPAGFTLPPDHYRLVLPNTGSTVIKDIFNNQLDGEFRGNLKSDGTGYETLMQTGQYRNGLSGDGYQGGVFQVGYLVVPNGNVIYARPDAQDNPNVVGGTPDGSLEHPYATLAPEGNPAFTFTSGPFIGQPDLNSVNNFGAGFNPIFDRNNDGVFERSALFAAKVASVNGPVVVVALPALTDPTKTFVLAPGAGTTGAQRDGSASLPFNTTMVFQAGSILKMSNASLFAQNQGTAIQVRGGANPGESVIITSLSDDSAGGDTNNDGGDTQPLGGDWGGLVVRNFDQLGPNAPPNGSAPPRSITFPIDGRLKGTVDPNTGTFADARSGADEELTIIDHADIRFGGGTVPRTLGTRYDSITLYDSRVQVSNTSIEGNVPGAGNAAQTQAAISGDLDSFREDDLYRGPVVRRVTFVNNTINGILVRAQPQTGFITETNAIGRPDNLSSQGGTQNYTFESPVPYVLAAQLVLGYRMSWDDLSLKTYTANRLYVAPGMIVKSGQGAGIALIDGEADSGASLIVGDRSFIRKWDADHTYSARTPGFQYNPTAARPIFTSLFDDSATTSYTDPLTQVTTTIVPASDTNNDGSGTQPVTGNVPFNRRWGGIEVGAGARAVIDQADFRFGGGSNAGPETSTPSQSVLAMTTPTGSSLTFASLTNTLAAGAFVMVTNNNFTDNFDAAMQVDPDSLLSADPVTPLVSGHPFFRGNVMQRNDIDGMAVVATRSYTFQGNLGGPLIRPQEAILLDSANQFVSTTWDASDLTYVLRGSIILSGFSYFGNDAPPSPNPTAFGPQRQPALTLTIQSAIPGTVLANGDVIANPGESVNVKLMNDFAPHGAGSLGTFGSSGDLAETQGGAGFLVNVDDGVDPPADPLLDTGAGSQLRILGIAANETTGQARVPVRITSLRDGTVGTRVRGVDMFNIYNRDPLLFPNGGGTLTTPAAGDGGYIYYGGSSLFSYNLLDPRQGSVIDNADIRYMTRIEIQTGGIIDAVDTNGDNSFTIADNWRTQKLGINPINQNNSSSAMTISNSNIGFMSDAAVFMHPTDANALVRPVNPITGAAFGLVRSGARGQGGTLFMYNNTIYNSGEGVHVNSEVGNGIGQGDAGQSPEQLVLLNNTFDANGIGLHTESPQFNNNNDLAHVYWLAMNNIFADSTNLGIFANGQQGFSQAQFNLFSNNANDIRVVTNDGDFLGNNFAIFGNAQFLDPTNHNFNLRPNSPAIDAARSEIGPLPAGDALAPLAILAPDGSGGVRNATGRSNPFGGFAVITDPNKIVPLPGSPLRSFIDQWQAVVPGTPGSFDSPIFPTSEGFSSWLPVQGERDQNGRFRQDAPNTPNTGFGSKPFLDIGAFEYRQLTPPVVTDVSATTVDATTGTATSKPIYVTAGIGGINQNPQTITVKFSRRLDPGSITANSVQLFGAGLDHQLNTTDDVKVPLAGKLIYDPTTSTLTINVGAAGLALGNDLYLLKIFGDGSDIIRDTSGNALDGENLDSAGLQKPLPSGDGFPGGNFQVTFSINTNSPSVVAGTLAMDPSTVTGSRPNVTLNTLPAFSGQITDVFPPTNPLINQQVIIDVSTKGDGVFDVLNAGQGVTDAQGRFRILLSKPLPDSPRNVGPDGLLGTADDLGYSLARVRVINTSGNQSNPNDPNAQVKFWIDTTAPAITGATPASSSLVQATTDANGQRVLPVSVSFNENINIATINTVAAGGGILVQRSGGTGNFNNPINLSIDTSSIKEALLFTPGGDETVSFNVTDATGKFPNDLYRITFPGVKDIAGNTVSGSTSLVFTVFDPSLAHRFFVDAGNTNATPDGSRANPYKTIQAAIDKAGIGDIVAVLPPSGSLAGPPPTDYRESITLKSEVRVLSADPSSTDSSFVPGNALNTVIRAPDGANPVTVTGTNLFSAPGLDTELSGFTIANALVGNPATGPIRTTAIGLSLTDSDVLIDRNYFINSGTAISVSVSGVNTAGPRLQNNVVVGNLTGIAVIDGGATSYRTPAATTIYNNTISFNTIGIQVSPSTLGAVDIANNILAFNNDRANPRSGAAIQATAPGLTSVRFNLFWDNGASQSSNADDVIGVGGNFNPNTLGTAPDALGNFVGNPQFVNARDPRPAFDGPGFFYTDSDFGIKKTSAAIDNALQSLAPATDFLGRSRVDIPGVGFAGRGPADLGAFEFNGTGGSALGGRFRVVTSSISTDGSARASGASLGAISQASPKQVVVTFSRSVDRASVTPGDLTLTGSGINPANPARATSLTWLDDHTAVFNLTGTFVPGQVSVSIPSGSVHDVYGTPLDGFGDSFKLDPNPVVGPPANTPPVVVSTQRRSVVTKINGRNVSMPGLSVTFNEAMKAGTVTKTGSYTLYAGHKVRGKLVFDRKISIRQVTYNAATHTANLVTTARSGVPTGPLRLVISDKVHDSSGKALDGNRDGKAGGSYSVRLN